MFDFWETELTDEETEALLDKAAFEVTRRKLEVPAIIALELHKPMANIGAHGILAMSPFLVPFFGFDFVNNYSRVFAKRENIERLITRLEVQRGTPPASTEDSCLT
jgi:hypothetical protein